MSSFSALISLTAIAISTVISETIWFDSAETGDDFTTSGTVAFDTDHNYCSDGCAQITATFVSSYMQTVAIDTSGYEDIAVTFNFALADGWSTTMNSLYIYYYTDPSVDFQSAFSSSAASDIDSNALDYRSVSLPNAADSETLYIRFTASSLDGNTNGVAYVFDIAVSGTAMPTTTPTTSQPSYSPSPYPTPSPSPAPTAGPSPKPTPRPTTKPTKSPTKQPTKGPTSDPSHDPTIDPTADPSSSPSHDPTNAPTSDPMPSPTIMDSISPTKSPSLEPSILPTNHPTDAPTNRPTTTAPSSAPSIGGPIGSIIATEGSSKNINGDGSVIETTNGNASGFVFLCLCLGTLCFF